MKRLWPVLIANNIPGKSGCEKCEDGYIRIPKEPIGWDSKECSCLVENESLRFSRKLLEHSNLNCLGVELYPFTDWKEPVKLTFEILKGIALTEKATKNWLFIYGSAGTGKTYATHIVARIAILKEKYVYYANVTELLDDLRPKTDVEIEQGAKTPFSVLKACKNADVLILDDIGHEKSSQWVRERFYLIINSRWENGKITIFTSNFDIENIKETISDAVYSRVKGNSLVVKLESETDKRLNIN